MLAALHPNRALLLFGGLVLGVYGVAWYLRGLLPLLPAGTLVASALIVDLVLGVPLLYYGLVVRKRQWPVFLVAPVFLLSLFLARVVVPEGATALRLWLPYLVAPVELLVVGYIAWRSVQVGRRLRAAAKAGNGADALARFQLAAQEVVGIPRVAQVLAYEVALIYYVGIGRQPAAEPPEGHFTMHRTSGYGQLLAALLIVMVLELVGVHVLVQQWHAGAAWVLTALSAYGILWILGDYRALALRMTEIHAEGLVVRLGLRWNVTIPFSAVEALYPITPHTVLPKRQHLTAVAAGNPAYLMTFRHPVQAAGIYGIEKPLSSLAFSVDDPARFEADLTRRFAQWQSSQGDLSGRPRHT